MRLAIHKQDSLTPKSKLNYLIVICMSELISLSGLFGASKGVVSISMRLAKAFKLIESIESKVALLMQAEFDAAWKTLLQACNSSSSDEQQSILVNEARTGFTKATCLEKGERLFYAQLGLAICHYLLNDINNAKIALLETTKISIYKDIYQRERDSNFGFNKYGIDSIKNSYTFENMLNLIKVTLQSQLYIELKKEIKKYNKCKTPLIEDISKKLDAEEKIIRIVTKVNQPSNFVQALEVRALELIKLQKECLEIINHI
jgi:hypothetical protein